MFIRIIPRFFHPSTCCQLALKAFGIYAFEGQMLMWLNFSTPISGRDFSLQSSIVYVEIGQHCGMCCIIGKVLVMSQHVAFKFFKHYDPIPKFLCYDSFPHNISLYTTFFFSLFWTSDSLYNCLFLFMLPFFNILIKFLSGSKLFTTILPLRELELQASIPSYLNHPCITVEQYLHI